MARKSFNDILPPEGDRSIRDISRSRTRVGREPLQQHDEDIPAAPPRGRGGAGFFSRYGIWIVAFAVLAVFVIAFSLIFSGSKIVVTPKQKDVTIAGQFIAAAKPLSSELGFETMEIKAEASETVTASGTENVEERASGKIVIFNDFSSKSQRLITNTRFETSGGLVYRIRGPIVVPGQSEGADGSIIPGSIEVTVYADEAGEKYNIELSDFTIPGFKGSPQYDKFFARSKTLMTGGFVGERVSIDKATLTTVTTRLQAEVREQLQSEAESNQPDGFYLFNELLSLDFPAPEIIKDDSGSALVKQTGIGHAVIFRAEDLAGHIARETVAGYDDEPVRLESVEALVFKASSEALPAVSGKDTFTFDLEGTVRIIWLFDATTLKNDLSGRSKDALPTILSGYVGINKAEVVLRPFWKQAFPENPEKITVETRLSK